MKKQLFSVLAALSLYGAIAQNNVLHFDGTNDYVSVPHNTALNLVNLYTFEAWVNPTGTSFRTILSKGDGQGFTGNGEYIFQVTGTGQLALYASFANGWVYSPAAQVPNNIWSHVAATNDGVNIKLYVNGALVTTSASAVSTTANPGANPFYLGRQGTSCNCNFLSGSLDEVKVWNTARTLTQIQAGMNGALMGNEPGLVAYYRFNQGQSAGNNTAVPALNDLTANAFNGTFNNFTMNGLSSNFLGMGEALNFDGSNDHVSIPHNNQLNLVNMYSFEAWVNPLPGGFRTIVSKGDGQGLSGTGEYIFQITGTGQLALYATSANGWKYSSANAVPNNVWSHVAVTHDGSNIRFYVNGALVTSSTAVSSATNPGTSSFYIGRQGTACNCNFFMGSLDEVRVWNTALSQCDINTYMNCEISAGVTGLVAAYHFNHGIAGIGNSGANTLSDASNNSFHGTLANFAQLGNASNWVAPGGVISWSVTPLSPPQVSITASNATICQGASVTLSGAGANTYTWTGGITDNTPFAPGGTTTYTVTGTNTLSTCSGTATQLITVNALPTLAVNHGTICAGDSFTLAPTGATTYSYSGGNAVVSPASTTVYTISGSDTNGCTGSPVQASVTVNPLPTVSVNSGTICNGMSFSISPAGASNYSVSGGNMLVSPASNTSYTVTGVAGGCSNTAIANVIVSPCTGMGSQAISAEFALYPNPSHGWINIAAGAFENDQVIEIYNGLGQLVTSHKVYSHETVVNLEGLPNGIYIVRVNTRGETRFTGKIIKE